MSTLTDPTATPEGGTPRRRRSAGAMTALVLAVVVVVAAVVVAVVALTRPDDSPGTASNAGSSAAASTAQIQQACQQWLADGPTSGQPRPDTQWCAGLTGWMAAQMGSGHMVGPMMWQDPDTLVSTCVRAMSGYPGAAGDPAQWCRDMVAWMSEHRGQWAGDDGWDGWHMGPR